MNRRQMRAIETSALSKLLKQTAGPALTAILQQGPERLYVCVYLKSEDHAYIEAAFFFFTALFFIFVNSPPGLNLPFRSSR